MKAKDHDLIVEGNNKTSLGQGKARFKKRKNHRVTARQLLNSAKKLFFRGEH